MEEKRHETAQEYQRENCGNAMTASKNNGSWLVTIENQTSELVRIPVVGEIWHPPAGIGTVRVEINLGEVGSLR